MKTKQCKEEEIPDLGIRVVISEAEEPDDPIYCTSCCMPINQNDPLFFSGDLGCERCVRAHYEREYRALTTRRDFNKSFESVFQSELKFRRSHGARVLKQHLRMRRSEQSRRDRHKGWGY
jgi:hypothetical protein